MIELEDIYFSYNKKNPALEIPDLKIAENTTTALLGTNGSGKTTLLFIIAGVYKCHGQIKIGHQTVSSKNRNKIRDKIGFVFQNPDEQLFMPSIKEELSLTLLQKNNYIDKEAISRLLQRFNIEHLKNTAPHKLSEGEKKKAVLCSMLIGNPDIMIFDEPTSHLDIRGKKEFITIINKIKQTKIISTHDLNFAKKCCEYVIILSKGKILAHDSFQKILLNKKLLSESGLI